MTKINYVEDCQKIQSALLSIGYEATLSECQDLWEERSNSWDASWLYLDDKSHSSIIEEINEYTKQFLIK